MDWFDEPKPARLEERLENGVVKCHLSPRNCMIKPGRFGFCRVRANQDGRLVTLNFGKSVHATEETIETEAIFHYAPGERILSMGNVGCMLNCDYCHNWNTSQARFVKNKDVYSYTPQQVVDIAKRHDIRVISWTYNDPVVWHEFVIETAALAKEAGIVNLYKSAFFITPEAIDELLPVIDIFSISIKSMDSAYYKRLTKGWIEPVLEGVKQVYRTGKHLEVSMLMVTDISDDENSARSLAKFVLEELDSKIPVHFVRFHPDYKMTKTIRTPIARLECARKVALEMGVQHVYLGNVYDTESTNSICHVCGNLLVTRYGLTAKKVGLARDGKCARCGVHENFKLFETDPEIVSQVDYIPSGYRVANFKWHDDIRSVHIHVKNVSSEAGKIFERRFGSTDTHAPWIVRKVDPLESYRFIAAKAGRDEVGVEIAVPAEMISSLHEVLDRAHFPTRDEFSTIVKNDENTFHRDMTEMLVATSPGSLVEK